VGAHEAEVEDHREPGQGQSEDEDLVVDRAGRQEQADQAQDCNEQPHQKVTYQTAHHCSPNPHMSVPCLARRRRTDAPPAAVPH